MPRSKKKITAQNKKPAPGRNGNGMGSLRQIIRNGNFYWEGRFSVKDPLTGEPKQRSISGKDRTDVYNRMIKAQMEVNEGTYIEPSKMTVSQWLDIWLDTYVKPSVKPLTVLNYAQHINNHIKPALGSIRLDKLNPHTIQNFYNDLGTAHGDKPGLSPKTIKCSHGILRKALQQAVEDRYLRTNPANNRKLPKAEQKEITPLDDKAIQDFLKAIEGHRFEVIFLVTLFTGLRRGEVCGLTWDCVNLDRGTITINKQLQNIPGHPGEYRLVPTKNSKTRTIVAADFIIDALRQYKVQQTESRLMTGPDWKDEGFVFTNEVGHRVSPHTVYDNYKRIVASIGRPNARLHDLRHSYATMALRAGDDIKTVQESLGHATAAFTLSRYAHVTEEMKRDSADRMQNFAKKFSGA